MTQTDLQPDYLDGSFRRKSMVTARHTVWIVSASLLIAVIWSAFAQINEITRGDGTVVPLRRMQTIQSLEGGILSELLVHEGDIVREGQAIAKIDATRFRSAFLETTAEIDTLRAEIARLEAEVMESDKIEFSGDADGEARANELRLFQARRTKLNESIGAAEAERAAIIGQIDITEPLAKQGSVSKVDLLRLQQQEAELQGRISELRNNYVQEAYRDLVAKKGRLVVLEQQMIQKQDQLDRTEIRSPVSGRVNNVNITTLGGVVQPGESIMEVTPIDDQLMIETKVSPRDVAFIAPGMPASVKITAYDFSTYGDLRGTVSQISGDTVDEQTANGVQAYYRVMVTTEKSYLERNGEELPIRPGMVAQVDIESGRRSVLSYLTRPILRAQLR
ncbi:HlyD family efflux transporter periplasmic adaptor subunit [Pseudomonas sp. GX19020]|uniref:HlyD family efflux transporter periplasmic adaptor subunit n=1 Tax=Pseudomonadota TaxID=1224 RepID=UPI00089C7569|nr:MULTISPECIES: HlyD family efflux transporter periplasmic adaptor subunit [Pseudomonadota]MCL4067137.1 HlyD family efflux transporter periplasmic adaptor subunit [Pseudomonas sp. GX19020]SED30967.1 membrane fusion protein, adhesin transport system [Rhodobacter sp. 24-YEA-8]